MMSRIKMLLVGVLSTPKKYKMATLCSQTVGLVASGFDLLDEMIGMHSTREISDLQLLFLDAIS